MDEITLFTEFRPDPPADPAILRQQAHDLLTAAMSSAAPGQPARRGRVRRKRFALAGAAATAVACAAIVVPTVVPAGSAGSFVTSAWAVQRTANGTVTVTLRDTTNPAGLQRALRAAGVRTRVVSLRMVHVKFKRGTSYDYPSCSYPTQGRFFEPARVLHAVVSVKSDPGVVLAVIHPSAMPARSVLFIVDTSIPNGSLTSNPTVLRSDRLPRCVPPRMPPTP